jgi:hypothetical protein
VDDVFPDPIDPREELITSLLEVNKKLGRVINDAHFYMSRDGNAFKAFQLLDQQVSLMGDAYS